jgi:hypothetical protein
MGRALAAKMYYMTIEQLREAQGMLDKIVRLSEHIGALEKARDRYGYKGMIYANIELKRELLDFEDVIFLYIAKAKGKLASLEKEFDNFSVISAALRTEHEEN